MADVPADNEAPIAPPTNSDDDANDEDEDAPEPDDASVPEPRASEDGFLPESGDPIADFDTDVLGLLQLHSAGASLSSCQA